MLLVLSFVVNLIYTEKNSTYAFFILIPRAWEFLCGGLIASICVDKINIFSKNKEFLIYKYSLVLKDSYLAIFGLVLILVSFVVIDSGENFPGYLVLLPVLGTSLILISNPAGWINKKILSCLVLTSFGSVSYSLYLIHWPVLAYSRILQFKIINETLTSIFLLFISILFSWIFFKVIEVPFRKKINSSFGAFSLLLMLAIISFISYSTYHANGFPWRKVNSNNYAFRESLEMHRNAKKCFDIPYAYRKNDEWFCTFGNKNSSNRLFFSGDSHALALLPAIERYADESNAYVFFAGASGCPSLLGIQSLRGAEGIEKFNCRKLNEKIFNFVKNNNINYVILANRWNYYSGSILRPNEFQAISQFDNSIDVNKVESKNSLVWALKNTISEYSEINVKVILIEDVPQQPFDPREILRKNNFKQEPSPGNSVSTNDHEMDQKFVKYALDASGSKNVKLDDILCDASLCPILKNNKFLYADDDHLSVVGAEFIYPHIKHQLDTILK